MLRLITGALRGGRKLRLRPRDHLKEDLTPLVDCGKGHELRSMEASVSWDSSQMILTRRWRLRSFTELWQHLRCAGSETARTGHYPIDTLNFKKFFLLFYSNYTTVTPFPPSKPSHAALLALHQIHDFFYH